MRRRILRGPSRRSVSPLVFLASTLALSACADVTVPAPPVQAVTTRRASVAAAWTPVASMSAGRVTMSVATGPDGRVYAIGGDPSGMTSTAEAYDPATDSWTGIAGPSALGNGAATTAGGLVFNAGGYTARDLSRVVETYDRSTNAWSMFDVMTEWRANFGMVTGPDGLVYFIGGWTRDAISSDHVETLDPVRRVWTKRAPLPRGLTYVAATVANGKIYVVGGSIIGGIVFDATAAVEAYDPRTDTWTSVSSMPAPRQFHSAVTGADGKIYVVGGSDGNGTTSDVFVYDPVADSWTTGPSLPVRNYLGAAAAVGNRVYFMGGNDPFTGRPSRDVFALQLGPPPPEEQVDDLSETVATLLASGELNGGNANSLQSMLAAVQAAIASGNTNSASGQLGAFVNKVRALVKTGRLSAPAGAGLTDAAQTLLATLGG